MIVLGLDTSYTRTGIAVAEDNKLIKVASIKFKGLKSKSEKRFKVTERLKAYIEKYNPDVILVERTRQFSAGFMSMNAISAQITMTAIVVDVAFLYDIPVYSVDTRSWKSQILGTSKPKDGNKKGYAIDFVKSLGFDVYDDDDACDAACIALYKFIPEINQKLKLEK